MPVVRSALALMIDDRPDMAEGLTARQTASRLGVRERTVTAHLSVGMPE